MSLLQHIMERIRSVVGLKGWNYCVFWKLSEDQRFLELMDCCCAGTENNMENINNNCGEDVELLLPVSSAISCRDVMFQHPRTKSCDLLSQLPSSIPLDSGIHAQTLISDQPRWLINFSNSCHSHLLEEPVETKVLIPVSVGLIELFVDKQVSEDQRMIDFITSQFKISNEQQTMTTNSSFSVLKAGSSTIVNENDEKEFFQPPVTPATMLQNLNLQYDISEDQIPPLHSSPMNFFQQFNHVAENGIKNLLEISANEVPDSMPLNPFKSSAQGFDQEDVDTLFQKSMLINSTSTNATAVNNVEPLASKKRQNEDRDSMNRSDSFSDCSDQNEDEDNISDVKCRRRNGNKGPQSKNLVAERNRRKKLNERLYNLRSLVPKITKLDRASILGDAIEYVMELQQQVRDLQNELERNIDLDDEGTAADDNHSSLQSEVLHGNGNGNEVKNIGPKSQHGNGNGTPHMGASSGIGTESTDDKVQQMEPQVEVIQLNGKEFFVKVFCEHKPGGFVKLMEALNSLGLEVTNVNVTSVLSLVLNVFKVERKDSEMVEADHVRESLLELTRNPPRGWPEMSKAASEQINGSGSNSIDNYHHYHHHQNTLHLQSHQLISQPNHHIHHLP